jgi:adenylate cyclase
MTSDAKAAEDFDRDDAPGGVFTGWIAGARLISGLVLFGYVTTHLINHAAGLWSIEAMHVLFVWFLWFWDSVPGTIALYGGLTVHVSIALRAVVMRDRFRDMWPPEIAQLALGLLIPLLLIDHVIATRGAYELYGAATDYTYVLYALWIGEPFYAVKQAVALIVAWGHGCIGLHFWLQFKGWYRRWSPALLALAVFVPTVSLAGFVASGMEIRQRAEQPDWTERAVAQMKRPSPEQRSTLSGLMDDGRIGYVALVIAAFAANGIRSAFNRRRRSVTLRYGTGEVVRATRGRSVLETSRLEGIPHASVCGGRGRCSTCRVRIGAGLDLLNPPSESEAKVLRRIGAPPNVRLACQTRVVDGLEVTPLLPPHTDTGAARGGPGYRHGRDIEIAVLFADIRGFTTISEGRLPYDVVFILNRYFAEMGAAIEGAGGRLDKFIGDGIMALFGVDSDPVTGSRQALEAARAMSERLVELNLSLTGELSSPLKIGIGIHTGPCIVGELGYGKVRGLTAVGDTVNTASRLEGLTKQEGVQLIVSHALMEHAGVTLPNARATELPIRGREEPLKVWCVEEAPPMTDATR